MFHHRPNNCVCLRARQKFREDTTLKPALLLFVDWSSFVDGVHLLWLHGSGVPAVTRVAGHQGQCGGSFDPTDTINNCVFFFLRFSEVYGSQNCKVVLDIYEGYKVQAALKKRNKKAAKQHRSWRK